MVKKVLVVGGAGYIGGCVTDYLLNKEIPFTVYDNLIYEHQYLKPVDFIYGDVRDVRKLEKILPLYSHIIWLAAIVGDGACAIKPELTKEVNQDSVEWLANNYNGKIIFTSTCSVYGANTKPVDELSELNPLSKYAETKLHAENFLSNKNALIFRLGTAFGLSDTYSRIRMDLAINYMTMNAVKNKKLTVFGGEQYRPFVHVRDIGKFIVDNLDTPRKGIYNLATTNMSILEIAKLIHQETGCKIEITKQLFEDKRNYNAITKKGLADGVFSDKTSYTIPFGIHEIKELTTSQRIKNLELELYSNEKYLLQILK
ncbi:MAG: SDR family oxidoreductase [Candidatus Parcubacteria bacterium]|nr:SDR family oxidoreductase [Candidatus Parcubacteria bacterium]